MTTRPSRISDAEMAAIEHDLDELEEALRAGRSRAPVRDTSPAALRPRPAAFVRAVVDGQKPHVAAAAAGYRGARMAASRLLRDPRVRAEIARLKEVEDAAIEDHPQQKD